MKYKTYYFGRNKEIEIIILDEPNEDNMLGMVNSRIFKKETIGLHITAKDDTNDIPFGSLYISSHNAQPMIAISNETYSQCNGLCPLLATIIFHELGHYKLGHCENIHENNDEIRINAVKRGEVDKKELYADQFAVDYLGAPMVIDGLERLKSLPVETDCNDMYFLLSNKEIDLRIKAISQQFKGFGKNS